MSMDEQFDQKFPIWVGDIPLTATEAEMTEFFGQFGQIQSMRLSQAKGTQNKRQYAFVNFATGEARQAAVDNNGIEFQGSQLQIVKRQCAERWHQIFVGNLCLEDEEQLKQALDAIGSWNIVGVRMNKANASKKFKYAFVFFNNAKDANDFFDDMEGKEINGVAVTVEFPRASRTSEEKNALRAGVEQSEVDKARHTVYISGLDRNITEVTVRSMCAEFGEIANIKIPQRDGQGRGMAFVHFRRINAAIGFVEACRSNPSADYKAELSKVKFTKISPAYSIFGTPQGWGGRGGYGNFNRGGYGRGRNGYGTGDANQQWMSWYSFWGQQNQRGRGGRGGRGRGNHWGTRGGFNNNSSSNSSRGGYGNTYQQSGNNFNRNFTPY